MRLQTCVQLTNLKSAIIYHSLLDVNGLIITLCVYPLIVLFRTFMYHNWVHLRPPRHVLLFRKVILFFFWVKRHSVDGQPC